MIEDRLYLRSALIVIRYERSGRFVIIHLGSSAVLPTDALGAHAARLFLLGHDSIEIGDDVERRCPGARDRWLRLMSRLDNLGATSRQPPDRTGRWRWRTALSLALGPSLSLLTIALRILPLWSLQAMYEGLPKTPLGTRILGQSLPWIDANLRASGYAAQASSWRRQVARTVSAAMTRTYFLWYLCLVLPQATLTRLFLRLTQPRGIEDLARIVEETDGAIIAITHSDLGLATAFYMRRLGRPVALLADVWAAGITLASDNSIRGYFPFADLVDSARRMAGKALLTRLRAGHLVLLPLDAPPQGARAVRPAESGSVIPFLGQRLTRFDGVAWLAVQGDKPIFFVGTYREGRRVLVDISPPFTPPSTLPREQQIERLTTQIYRAAEAFVRQHPESWLGWSYLHTLDTRPQTG